MCQAGFLKLPLPPPHQNALLLSEFPHVYDDRCAAGTIPLDARALTQCINSRLDGVGAPFRRRRFAHSLLMGPYRHLEGDGKASSSSDQKPREIE